MIFVFGSNSAGVHGAGAARFANLNHGAIMGYGEGRSGNSYALPTKHTPYKRMSISVVETSINRFMHYANTHPQDNFQITQVGCGRGGFTKEEIAPLFAAHQLGPNLYFDRAWQELLPSGTRFWGSI